jgi:selenocysteine-specific translation elongation factor
MLTTAKRHYCRRLPANADRLPEEKARGMTIDLGYAYWPQPDGRVLGFIDVPGHENFCPICWRA